MMTDEREDCACTKCQNKPGWFLPAEVERVAEHLDLPLEEVFQKYLMADYWEADHEIADDVFVLAPAIVGETPGEEYPADPQGTCVFYRNGRCSIHPVKPFECREYLHNQSTEVVHERHLAVARAWQAHQEQITMLLGREPEIEAPYDGGGLLGGWLR